MGSTRGRDSGCGTTEDSGWCGAIGIQEEDLRNGGSKGWRMSWEFVLYSDER
jgi:hypothetical protein